METTINQIELKTTKYGSIYWRCHLKNSFKVDVFDNRFYIFDQSPTIKEVLLSGQSGDVFTITEPIPAWIAENDRGFLEIVRIKHPDEVIIEKQVPIEHQHDYQVIASRSAQKQIKMLAELTEFMDVICFDFETTGKYADTDEIVSYGVCSYGIHSFEEYQLVKPTESGLHRNKTSGAIEVHHITNESLTDAKTFPEIYSTLYQTLSDSIWVVYNTNFDVKLLDRLCLQHGLERIPRVGVHCMMELYSEYMAVPSDKKGFKWHKLTDACEQHDVKLDNAHNALSDAKATYDLMMRLSEMGMH